MRCVQKYIFYIVFFMCAFMVPAHAESIPGDSLYQIAGEWYDSNEKRFSLKDLHGDPVVLSLIYLSCEFTCPTIVAEVQQMLTKIQHASKSKVKVVLVSFDPVGDTPKVMKNFLKKRKLSEKQWTLMTTKDESKIRELAAALNFKYQKDDNGEFTHSYMIATLDHTGVLKARVDGANLDKKLLIDSIVSTLDRK